MQLFAIILGTDVSWKQVQVVVFRLARKENSQQPLGELITLLRVIPTMTFQDIYVDMYSVILPTIVSNIYSDIYSDIISDTLKSIWHIFWQSI